MGETRKDVREIIKKLCEMKQVELVTDVSEKDVLEIIERAGRVCYKSENKIEDGTAEKFRKDDFGTGHESVIEHMSLTVKVICDRGVSHEIVRHRLTSMIYEKFVSLFPIFFEGILD